MAEPTLEMAAQVRTKGAASRRVGRERPMISSKGTRRSRAMGGGLRGGESVRGIVASLRGGGRRGECPRQGEEKERGCDRNEPNFAELWV